MPKQDTSALWSVVDAQQQGINNKVAHYGVVMAQEYAQAAHVLLIQAQAITDKIDEAQANGEPVSPAWLFQQDRYKELLKQTTVELQKFVAVAGDQIDASQRTAINAALAGAQAMAAASLAANAPSPQDVAQVMAGWQHLPTDALNLMVATTSPGSPLHDLLKAAAGDGVKGVKDALVNGVLLGHGSKQIAKNMQMALGGNLARALTIARTESHRAAREAAVQSYARNSHIVMGWRWRSARTDRTCAMCWAMDGSEFYPERGDNVPMPRMATHVNCRCFTVPITRTWDELGFKGIKELPDPPPGAADFAQLTPEQQRKILGPGKFAAYQAGSIHLSDLVGTSHDPRWGSSRHERSLSSALKAAGGRKGGSPGTLGSGTRPAVTPPTPPAPLPSPKQLAASKPAPPAVGNLDGPIQLPPSFLSIPSQSDFKLYSEAYQRQILGTERYEAWVTGRLKYATIKSHMVMYNRKSVVGTRNPALEQEAATALKKIQQLPGPQRNGAANMVKVKKPARFFVNYGSNTPCAARAQAGVQAFKDLVAEDNIPPTIRLSTAKVGLLGQQATDRSYYTSGSNTLFMSDYYTFDVATHEAGHWYEDINTTALAASQTFLLRRTNDMQGLQPMSKLQPGKGYGPFEKADPDDFYHPYIGSHYTNATEVMSMGLQRMATDPYGFANADPDMFMFVYMNARDPAAALAYQRELEHQGIRGRSWVDPYAGASE